MTFTKYGASDVTASKLFMTVDAGTGWLNIFFRVSAIRKSWDWSQGGLGGTRLLISLVRGGHLLFAKWGRCRGPRGEIRGRDDDCGTSTALDNVRESAAMLYAELVGSRCSFASTATSLEHREQRDKCATYCWFSGRPGEDSAAACCPPRRRWSWGVHSCLSPLRVSPVTHRTPRIYHISRWHPSHTNLSSCPSFALFTHCGRPITDINRSESDALYVCSVKWCTRTS